MLCKPVQPSEELAAIIGSAPLPRAQVVSKIWDYIRSHKLQNSENRREIHDSEGKPRQLATGGAGIGG
jgi:chromatin remodeling complex protein RSC6